MMAEMIYICVIEFESGRSGGDRKFFPALAILRKSFLECVASEYHRYVVATCDLPWAIHQ